MDTLVSSTSPHLVEQMHAVSNSVFECASNVNSSHCQLYRCLILGYLGVTKTRAKKAQE